MPDENDEEPQGQFPPGLDGLNTQIERFASQGRQDLRGDVADRSEQFAPFLDAARRALAGVDGNPDALGTHVRKALEAVKTQAAVTMSGSSTLTAGGAAVHGAGAVLMAKASISAVGTVTAGPASVVVAAPPGSVVASPDSPASPASRTPLERLAAARIFYVVLIWLLVAGVGVVIKSSSFRPTCRRRCRPIRTTSASPWT